MGLDERAHIMATDPVACATHFRHVLNAIFKHLWCFNPEPGAQQSHLPGVFGHIEAFFGAIEEQVGALCRSLDFLFAYDKILPHRVTSRWPANKNRHVRVQVSSCTTTTHSHAPTPCRSCSTTTASYLHADSHAFHANTSSQIRHGATVNLDNGQGHWPFVG